MAVSLFFLAAIGSSAQASGLPTAENTLQIASAAAESLIFVDNGNFTIDNAISVGYDRAAVEKNYLVSGCTAMPATGESRVGVYVAVGLLSAAVLVLAILLLTKNKKQ